MNIIKSLTSLATSVSAMLPASLPKNFQNHLLAYFIEPRLVTNNKVFRRWEEPAGKKIDELTQPLIKLGLLRDTDDVEFLEASKKLTELKSIAKHLGQKQTGTKEEIAQRIAPLYLAEITKLRKKNKALVASAAAIPIINEFQKEEDERLATALAKTRSYLENGQTVQAIREYLLYTNGNPLVIEPVVIPNNAGLKEDARNLDLIFSASPKYLTKRNIEITHNNRLDAAMATLWLSPADAKLELTESEFVIVLALQNNQSYLAFFADETNNLYKKYKVLNVNDSFICPECKKLEGKKFTRGNLPEMPYENCTCQTGCRCWVDGDGLIIDQ